MANAFDSADQNLANELCELLVEYCNTSGAAHEAADKRIKAIGTCLYENGGHGRMLEIHSSVNNRCNRLGKYGMGRVLENRWGGIGQWLS